MLNILKQKDGPLFIQAEGGNRPVMMDDFIEQIPIGVNQSLSPGGRENRFTTKDFLDARDNSESQSYLLFSHEPRGSWLANRMHTRERSRISKSIAAAIAESRSILELQDDWDGEGSPRYEPAVWDRATNFLKRVAIVHKEQFGVWIPAPAILAGPEGGIDLNWEAEQGRLLVHIPVSEKKPIDFYGDNRAGQIVKGQLPMTADYRWLLMWLTS